MACWLYHCTVSAEISVL